MKKTPNIYQVSEKYFGDILRINSECLPNVAKLEDNELNRVLIDATLYLVYEENKKAAAYLLGFLSSDNYDGQEFQYFKKRLEGEFLYIDQVAVSTESRGRGIGSTIYEYIEFWSSENGIQTICCEVNKRPENPVSLSFHYKIGFKKLEELETEDGRLVELLVKMI